MIDFYYVLKSTKDGRYLADPFHKIRWTKNLSKAKNFTDQHIANVSFSYPHTQATLVSVCEVDLEATFASEDHEEATNENHPAA